jgi:hypothetical protein
MHLKFVLLCVAILAGELIPIHDFESLLLPLWILQVLEVLRLFRTHCFTSEKRKGATGLTNAGASEPLRLLSLRHPFEVPVAPLQNEFLFIALLRLLSGSVTHSLPVRNPTTISRRGGGVNYFFITLTTAFNSRRLALFQYIAASSSDAHHRVDSPQLSHAT